MVRNRARRLFRTIFRQHLDQVPNGTDIVLIVRRSYPNYPYAELERRFLRVLGKR